MTCQGTFCNPRQKNKPECVVGHERLMWLHFSNQIRNTKTSEEA